MVTPGEPTPQTEPRPAVTGRVLLIALPLIVANAWWLMANWGTAGYQTGQSFATIISLYYNVLFSLVLLLAGNALLRRLLPRWALSEAELLTLFILLAVASSVAGHDTLQILFPALTYAVWFATPENRWGDFHRCLPDWLTIKDRDRLAAFYQGHSSLYRWDNLSVWLPPVLVWSGFFILLVLMMLGLVVLVKERWVKHEKLSYPIIQIPLAMTEQGGRLFRNRLLWVGFLLAAGMDLVNGLHVLYPQVPSLGGALNDVSRFFTGRPYSAMGWTPVALYPFAVGLSFFIPLDLSFSIWFFYVFGKITRIVGDVFGLTGDPKFPYPVEQSAGAWVGLAMMALWVSRKHLAGEGRGTGKGREGKLGNWEIRKLGNRTTTSEFPSFPVSQFPSVTRLALVGLCLGGVFLVGFCGVAGVSSWLTVLYFGLFFAIGIAITRVRAEVGPPSHDIACEPLTMLVTVLGSQRIGTPALTLFTLFNSVSRAYRCHPMPHLLEGFAITSRRNVPERRLVGAMVLAVVVGTFSCAWAYYALAYRHGGAMFGEQWQCRMDFTRLATWNVTPAEPSVPGLVAMLLGGGFTLLLMALRHRFLWFPLHPAGYALSLSPWNATWYWFSVLVGWLLKVLVLKCGGLGAYRRARPFFVGIVLGEFMMGAVWSLLGIVLEQPMYRFLF